MPFIAISFCPLFVIIPFPTNRLSDIHPTKSLKGVTLFFLQVLLVCDGFGHQQGPVENTYMGHLTVQLGADL